MQRRLTLYGIKHDYTSVRTFEQRLDKLKKTSTCIGTRPGGRSDIRSCRNQWWA